MTDLIVARAVSAIAELLVKYNSSQVMAVAAANISTKIPRDRTSIFIAR